MMPGLADQERIFINKYAYRLGSVERGDVVVFRYPGDPSKNYIKRIVGVPGDRIEIFRGEVLVNGSRLQEPYVPAQFRDERSMSEMTVPEDGYFVLGDHRNLSKRQPGLWGGGARGHLRQGGVCLLADGDGGQAAIADCRRRNTSARKDKMRLAIFGGTGGTGLELTRQALEQGHSVRVLVRNPNRMPLVNSNMRVVLGNVLDHESVTKTVLGADAVLSCLGQRNLLRNTRVCSVGTRLIIDVMKAQGVRRLVVESAFGAGESLAVASLMERLVFATLLWAPYQDKNLLEPVVKESGLEWTILRPTLLTNGQRTGRYVVTMGRPAVGRVARADVATAMLRAVTEGLWIGESPTVTGA